MNDENQTKLAANLRAIVQRSPLVRRMYRLLLGLNEGQKAWLFQSSTLRWLGDEKLRSQLPESFQLFGKFCSAQLGFPGPIVGSAVAFRIAQSHYLSNRGGSIRLKIDDAVIHLNPKDPRMLQVPRELRKMSKNGSILNQLLAKGDTFIDIGANHGAFSVAASKFVGDSGHIYAFEPQPELYPLIEKSLEASGAANFRVFSDACSDQEGRAQFFVPAESSGSAGLFKGLSGDEKHQHFEVDLVRLDDIIEDQEINGEVLIKLDVEGNELAVLRGATRFIQRVRPRLLMEINPAAMEAAASTTEEMVELLEDVGYRYFRRLEDPDHTHLLRSLKTDHYGDIVLEA